MSAASPARSERAPLAWTAATPVCRCNETDARRSICGLAHAMYFGRLIPGHDASAARGATWTQAHVQQLAAGIPECGAFAGTGGQPDDGDGLEEAEDADQQQEDEGDEYE